MSKVMLLNATHPEESRVAVIDDGKLVRYEIETANRAHIKGNIYNAKVESVHGGLEAAFLFLGEELKGFLPIDEVNFKLLPALGERGKGGKIGQRLRPGQKLLVQVSREPFGGKPPTVTTYFSLPGRYLVLMPGVDSAGISRRIQDPKEREQLRSLIDELDPPEGFGVIVRTAGIGQTKQELQRDLRYLLRLWSSIQKASPNTPFPGLVYQERDLVIRTIRDHLTPDLSEIWIDSPEAYKRARDFIKQVMPARAKLLKRHEAQRPIFNKFNLEEQIESIYQRRVKLPSGGEIVIDGTEALTAIDVNSARSIKNMSTEELATQTNLEAAREIARQLSLRDLGGLIVIDFIDMQQTKNRKKVERVIRADLKKDRAKFNSTTISKLGLMEIARQRLRSSKLVATYDTCPTCEGYGMIKNVEAAALAAFRKLQTKAAKAREGVVSVKLPDEVATWLLNHKRHALTKLESLHQLEIRVIPSETMLRHEREIDFDSTAQSPSLGEHAENTGVQNLSSASSPTVSTPSKAKPESQTKSKSDDDPKDAKPSDSEQKKRPTRRGRRGGRKRTSSSKRSKGGQGKRGSKSSKGSKGNTQTPPNKPGDRRPEPKPEAPPKELEIRADELMPAASPRPTPPRRRKRRGGPRSKKS